MTNYYSTSNKIIRLKIKIFLLKKLKKKKKKFLFNFFKIFS